jgi:hypothetical protein
MATVYFVDHGSSAKVPFASLRKYKKSLLGSLGRLRALAVRAELAGIKPHPLSGREGDFSSQTYEEFTRLVDDPLHQFSIKVSFLLGIF